MPDRWYPGNFGDHFLDNSKRIDAPFLGVGFYVGNLLIMVVISSLVKLLSDRYPIHQILLFRFVLAVVPIFFLVMAREGVSTLRTQRPLDHAIRSVSGVVSLGLFFYAVSLIPLAEATMLAYASPIFITLISIPVLGERIGAPRWFAVILGFIGVVIIVQPGSVAFGFGGVIAIVSAILAAVVATWLRRLSDTENTGTISVFYNGFGALVFIAWTFSVGWTPVLQSSDWIMLALVGLLASAQQLLFAGAFRYSEASLLAPFEYLILVFSAAAGYLVWQEVPSLSSITGGVIITISGLVILWRTRSRISKARSVRV